jgi:arginine exporter protein ArgO
MTAVYKFYLTAAGIVASQLLCAYIFGSELLEFHKHNIYTQALNSLGLPLTLYTSYRALQTAWQIHQDEKAHIARMRQIVLDHGRALMNNHYLFERFLHDLEAKEPKLAALVREELDAMRRWEL